jgi:5-methylcytosine-specific restriction endonuclease McrA
MSVTYIPTALRSLVYERANGCCEYCLISEAVSFARHLALSCAVCNKHKGSDIASIDGETGAIVSLFNPRQDVWSEYFKIENGVFIGLTPNARATIRLLQINNAARVEERRI